ncbi:transmembrane protein 236 [Meriones unguiculatus]|uniref:transmembrane protein 236 n=1 Tax=Meriones unguiculatus TaxID=10047 RepID=UPI000B4F7F4C|nr:transmembrane protein 236 [Meriones unguiculatus]XP_021513963.1 transmembrane protein 236 [Meriones unguiculatus]
MASGKIIKLLVFELLEFAAFSVPTLVIMEQFATAYQRTKHAPDRTHYWLIVSCSIAYVAGVSLLIWVPIKVVLYKKRHLYKKIIGWRPVLMMCVLLTTLPSFSFSIAVTEVQKNINGSNNLLPDSLPDLPVSLVLLSLIMVDIIEKLRIYPLRGSQMSYEDNDIHITSLQQIKTVTEQVTQNENTTPAQAAKPTAVSQSWHRVAMLAGPQEPSFHSGILRTMSHRDVRANLLLQSFLTWSDTIEMLRVAGHPAVYKTGWLYSVYIFSFISLLRMVFTPKNPLLSFLGVLLQDLPFIFLRLSLIIALGTITPVLGLCKNVLVTVSYIYFNYVTKLRPFSAFETSPF